VALNQVTRHPSEAHGACLGRFFWLGWSKLGNQGQSSKEENRKRKIVRTEDPRRQMTKRPRHKAHNYSGNAGNASRSFCSSLPSTLWGIVRCALFHGDLTLFLLVRIHDIRSSTFRILSEKGIYLPGKCHSEVGSVSIIDTPTYEHRGV